MAAVWQVGLNARVFAFTMVSLACVFITLLVAVGPSVHKDSETHEPVRKIHTFVLSYPIPPCLTLLGSDFVLDQLSVRP